VQKARHPMANVSPYLGAAPLAGSSPPSPWLRLVRPGRQRNLTGCALAVVLVLVVSGLRVAADRWLTHNPQALFLIAVTASSWFGGFRAGALATLLSAVLQNVLLIEPIGVLHIAHLQDAVDLGIWTAEGLVVCGGTAMLRDRNAALTAMRVSLELRVEERTGELATSHRQLSESFEALKSNQRILLSTEKMAAIGRLTAGIAHELASPLSAILSSASELEKLVAEYIGSIGDYDVGPDDHRAIARDMESAIGLTRLAAERSSTFVRGIKAQTRVAMAQETRSFDVVAMARDAVQLLAHTARAARSTLDLRMPSEPVLLEGDPGRLAQALSNLIHNAVDATGDQGGGVVRVSIDQTPDTVRVIVQDDGPGIPADVLPRIFEPLFTTKPYGKGTGLGLGIVKEAVEMDFAGSIEVKTDVGGGTRFLVELPRKKGDRLWLARTPPVPPDAPSSSSTTARSISRRAPG
jgi:signal transduction histidine kinase